MESDYNMKSIGFIGGDNRNKILYGMLKNEYKVFCYGLNKNDESNLKECIVKSKYIMLPIPITKDKINVYVENCDKNITLDELFDILNDKIIICGAITDDIKSKFEKNNKVIDIMKEEELVLKNTVPTAEGVLNIIIDKTDITIENSKVLIYGFGRVGKKIAELLYALNANVFCTDLKKEEVANIVKCGYNVFNNFDCKLHEFDIIVNTVPAMVINNEMLDNIDKKTLIIDVASYPGGVDYEYANKNKCNCIHALGLPGQIAPRTAAKYIKDVLIKLLN